MRKFIFSVIVLIAAASFTANMTVSAQDIDKKQSKVTIVSGDSSRAYIRTDSIRVRSQRLGQKIGESAVVAADSIGAFGERMSEKVAPVADTLVQRTRRAWRVLTGKDQNPQTAEEPKK